MHLKSTKKKQCKATKVGKNFTSEKLTSYSGLTVINEYVEKAFQQVSNAQDCVVPYPGANQ